MGDSDNEIEIVANGARYSKRKALSETLGWPTNQLSWEQVIAKFEAQAVPVVGAAQSSEIVARARELEHEDDISAIMRLLAKP